MLTVSVIFPRLVRLSVFYSSLISSTHYIIPFFSSVFTLLSTDLKDFILAASDLHMLASTTSLFFFFGSHHTPDYCVRPLTQSKQCQKKGIIVHA